MSETQNPVKPSLISQYLPQIVGGLIVIFWGIYTNLRGISPDVQAYGLLIIFVTLIAFLAVVKYSDDKKELNKLRIEAEVRKQESWNEHTRSPVESERATIEAMAKQWAIMTVYQSIISNFEESAKDDSRSAGERAFYVEVVKRLKDMAKAANTS